MTAIIGIICIIVLMFYIVGAIVSYNSMKTYDNICNKRLEEIRKQPGFDRLQYVNEI